MTRFTIQSAARALGLSIALLTAQLHTSVVSAQTTAISQAVASAYNEGVVRCGNAECAKYLFACFRSYSGATLEEFLVCGVQAARLNNNQLVVANP